MQYILMQLVTYNLIGKKRGEENVSFSFPNVVMLVKPHKILLCAFVYDCSSLCMWLLVFDHRSKAYSTCFCISRTAVTLLETHHFHC